MSLRGSWHLLLLGLVAAAAVVAAVLELGPPTSSARTSREIITAAKGVVQTTVSGTGNVEAGTDAEANFQTSGTLQHVYIKEGDHVVKGQLIATLDPTAAQSTLDQAEENLTSAEDQLTNAEEATVTTSTATATSGSSVEEVAFHPATTTTTTVTQTVAATTSTPTTTGTTPATTQTTTATSPSTTTQTTPATGGSGNSGSRSSGTGSSASGGSTASSSGGSSSSGSSSAGETAATKAANIASAEASVDGAEADVTNAETALHETHLYAPATGTVVSVESISPGDSVSGSSSSSSSSAASSTGSSSGGSTGATSAGSLGGSTSSGSSSTSSTSSGFAEIVNTKKMTMTVAFSESDISKVKVGQPATVTMEALTGVELGAHVSAISQLGTTSSSVVSYDATLTIDQHDSQVRPGMSATASVITAQAQGVTLPNTAVSTRGTTSTVNELRNGKTVSTPIVIGVQGDSRTQIVSGLKSGAQVVVTETLPSLGTSSTASGTGASGTLGGATSSLGAFPGAGGGGGGFGGGGGGFARRFSGG